MNAYDQKHLYLLRHIAAGDWRAIPEGDVTELQVLVVCKYVRVETGAAGPDRVVMTAEGEHYYNRLCAMDSMHASRSGPLDSAA